MRFSCSIVILIINSAYIFIFFWIFITQKRIPLPHWNYTIMENGNNTVLIELKITLCVKKDLFSYYLMFFFDTLYCTFVRFYLFIYFNYGEFVCLMSINLTVIFINSPWRKTSTQISSYQNMVKIILKSPEPDVFFIHLFGRFRGLIDFVCKSIVISPV